MVHFIDLAVAVKINTKQVLDKIIPILTLLTQKQLSLPYEGSAEVDSAHCAFSAIKRLYDLVDTQPCTVLDTLIINVSQATFPIHLYANDRLMFFKILQARQLEKHNGIFIGLLNNSNTVVLHASLPDQCAEFMLNLSTLAAQMSSFSLKDYPEIIIKQFMKFRSRPNFDIFCFDVAKSYLELGEYLGIQTNVIYTQGLDQLCADVNNRLATMQKNGRTISEKNDIELLIKLGTKINQALFISLSKEDEHTSLTLN